MRNIAPAERLIVAADFKPPTPTDAEDWVWGKVLALADSLKGTGVYLKVNSALRACGYDLIREIHERGLRVFADLKLFDIGETLATDGAFLLEFKPELLTVSCNAGIKAMVALREALPDTEILGITVLTSMTDEECLELYGTTLPNAVERLAEWALQAEIGGTVSSAKEVETIRRIVGSEMTINTPAIRPSWAAVKGDDQNQKRVMTPAEAILAGADRIVVGRPITQHANPFTAVALTVDEIASAVHHQENQQDTPTR